jgi:protein SHQ1
MPIIPRFTLLQDDFTVFIRINIPHVRINSMEIVAEHYDVSFYCKPYLLKLHLPHEVNGESERCKGVYEPDVENGIVTLHLPKVISGQYFENLDLLTTLLKISPSNQLRQSKRIEVISSTINNTDEDSNNITSLNDSKISTIANDNQINLKNFKYGFNNEHYNILISTEELVSDIVEVSNPDMVSYDQRRRIRLLNDLSKYDPERYLGDLYGSEEDMIFLEAKGYKPFYCKNYDILVREKKKKINSNETNELSSSSSSSSSSGLFYDLFSEDEMNVLSNSLKNKEFDIKSSSADESNILYGLIDILYCICYEYRITVGEFTVESATNITQLSSLLSHFDNYDIKNNGDDIVSLIRNLIRRSLTYPYLRYWDYIQIILTDACKVLFLGKRHILKLFLQLKILYDKSHCFYLLNKVYIDDYCIWLQKIDDGVIRKLAVNFHDEVSKFISSRSIALGSLGLKITELEDWASGINDSEGREEKDIPRIFYPEYDLLSVSSSDENEEKTKLKNDEKIAIDLSGVLNITDLLDQIKLSK